LLPVFLPLIDRACKQSFRRRGIAAESFLVLDHNNLPADAPFSLCDAPIRSGEIAQSFVTVWHGTSIASLARPGKSGHLLRCSSIRAFIQHECGWVSTCRAALREK
jgi:hypothetical protein